MLVLGSSTLAGISAELFARERVLNAWLTGPSIEDMEAIAGILDESKCNPDTILLGLDPWFFNPKVAELRWLGLMSDYWHYHRDQGLFFRVATLLKYWDRFKELLSFVTTRASLNFLQKVVRGQQRFLDVRIVPVGPLQYCNTHTGELPYVRGYDGYAPTCPDHVPPPPVVEEIAATYVSANRHQMGDWKEVDRERLARLDRLVAWFRARGSNVILLAPPYHPTAFSRLSASATIRQNLVTLDSSLQLLAQAHGAQFLNFRDPRSVGCEAAEFEDSHHFNASCFDRLKKHVLPYIDGKPTVQ
jgi:hypothetical protein